MSYDNGSGSETFPTTWSLGARVLPWQTYARVFTANQITSAAAFNSNIDSTDLGNGGYVTPSAETGWWAKSGTVTRDSSNFYLVTGFTDPFGDATTVAYDTPKLFPTTVTDALSNAVTATIDYRFLQPWKVQDPNGNRAEIAFDALGRVTKVAVIGSAGEGDTLTDPTEKYTYDLDRWVTSSEPARARVEKRETHASSGTRWLDRYDYSDGGGNAIHSKVMAEPAASTPTTPRWVGTGRIVVDNKGNVIKQYEPFFSANSDFEFESDLASSGVSNTVVYDPLGRPIQVDLANGTRRRVSFTPWSSTTWDENDCSTDSGLTADSALLARASAHAATPSTVKLDAQGRAYKTEELLTTSTTLTTKLTLDVVGNPTAVIDAINVTTQSQSFDMLGRPIQTDSPDAGETIAFMDVAGQPQEAWRSGSLSMRYTYDALRRRTHMYATEGGTERLKERNLYGEFSGAPSTGYYKGRLYRQYDTAGVVTTTGYDFKGNPLGSERVFWLTITNEIDWATLTGTSVSAIATQASSLLESTSSTTGQTYDALNRAVTQTTPDSSVTRLAYNEAGLLETVGADVRGVTPTTSFVSDIDYNARGQRDSITYGNGVTTTYEHDVDNFRLTRLRTVRASDSKVLQDLLYTYDPVGNITFIENNAEDTLYFNSGAVTPDQSFVYDALYRLTSATGREKTSATQPDHQEYAYGALAAASTAIQEYTEEYEYDPVGNIREFVHKKSSVVQWRRKYRYDGESETEPITGTRTNNRLAKTTQVGSTSFISYTHDARGNIVNMPHLYQDGLGSPNIVPDFRDQMKRAIINASDDCLYFYDAGGNRVRKVWRVTNQQERRYFGAWEYWEKRNSGGSVTDTLETLHVMDGQQRIALVETKTAGGSGTVQRYQLGNHLGTSVLELDSSAGIISYEEFHPYGSTAWWSDPGSTVSQKRYRYTGMEKDEESGLSRHGVRMYATWLGRWVSADPSGSIDGPNLFRFARNSPVRLRDPSGRAPPLEDLTDENLGPVVTLPEQYAEAGNIPEPSPEDWTRQAKPAIESAGGRPELVDHFIEANWIGIFSPMLPSSAGEQHKFLPFATVGVGQPPGLVYHEVAHRVLMDDLSGDGLLARIADEMMGQRLIADGGDSFWVITSRGQAETAAQEAVAGYVGSMVGTRQVLAQGLKQYVHDPMFAEALGKAKEMYASEVEKSTTESSGMIVGFLKDWSTPPLSPSAIADIDQLFFVTDEFESIPGIAAAIEENRSWRESSAH